MERKPIFRQGDVLLVPVTQIPQEARKQRSRRRLVLAEGEMTGHHHVLEVDQATKLEELLLPGDVAELEQRFVRVLDEAVLTHQEHATLTIPPGDYEVRRQREYAPEEIRTVAD